MPILDLYYHSEQKKNLAHFAAMATLAAVDGEINPQEKAVLDRLARKFDISKAEYKEVLKKSNQYPIEPQNDAEKRLERLYDCLKIIFADHKIDDEEMVLLKKYAELDSQFIKWTDLSKLQLPYSAAGSLLMIM